MKRSNRFFRSIRAVYRVRPLVKIAAAAAAAGSTSCIAMYFVSSRGALAPLAIAPVICSILIPVLFIGCTFCRDWYSRAVLCAWGVASAQVGGICGVAIYTQELVGSISSLPMSYFLWLMNPWGVAAFLAAIASAVAGSFVGAWLFRRAHEGICISCGYDLTNLTSGRCPECGHRSEADKRRGTSRAPNS